MRYGKERNQIYLSLKTWGCEAYVKRVDNNKLKPKSTRCLFVGYPKEPNGYYFYHPQEQKVFVSKHAVFLEKEFLDAVVSGMNVKLDEIRGELQTNTPSRNLRKIKHKMLCQFPNLPHKDFVGQQQFVMTLRDMDFSSQHMEMCF